MNDKLLIAGKIVRQSTMYRIQQFNMIHFLLITGLRKSEAFKIERKNITLPTNNLKSVGKFEADIVFHKEVSGKISFEIVED